MTEQSPLFGVYGAPPREVIEPVAGAVQFSPLVPGAERLEDLAEGALAGITLLAPPGTVERRYAMALSLKALSPEGRMTIAAPKDKGGSRLRKELETFGCTVGEDSRRHHRICVVRKPAAPQGLGQAIADGAPRFHEGLNAWTQPGVFSWDRVDPGSALLAKTMGPLAGKGADFGAGVGFLSKTALASPKFESLLLIDSDRRAVEAARRNVEDPRATILWGDVRTAVIESRSLDFVIMNPPFHDGGAEDKQLGQAFIRRAADVLRRSGTLWLVANRHLPYEKVLAEVFKTAPSRADTGGYKVFEARK
ncbi:MAG: class I SAM-dependent methyltransferase [Caulobacterales bacterium]|nr:class I SAM-dependent methyltransferase [Caulobacterales bacterium]